MVAAVRSGQSLRSVSRAFGVSLSTVQLWVARAAADELDGVDLADRSSARHRPPRIAPELEDLILDLRRELRDVSDLGEYGAAAIRRALDGRLDLPWPVPSVRTIGRVLDRRGVLDAVRRVRRPAPQPGWYLPDLAGRRCELDSFDVVDGLYLLGQPELGILTASSLHGGLPGAWPAFGMRTGQIVPAIEGHWRAFGLPRYAQFDNDPRFIGGHARPDSIGQVIRFCLGLGVVPVFAPPHETGFQAAIESLNGRWQAKVWPRHRGTSMDVLVEGSDRWVAAVRARSAVRIEAAPARDPYPALPVAPWRATRGRIVFLRRTTETGSVSILGHRLPVDRHWPYRLVRAELDIAVGQVAFFALRRREPAIQPLLATSSYAIPDRWAR
jgi:transposase-like protein